MTTALAAAPPTVHAATDILSKARLIAQNGIKTAQQADACAHLLGFIKTMTAEIEANYDPAVKAAHEAHKAVIAARSVHTDALEEAEKLIRAALNKFVKDAKANGTASFVPVGMESRDYWKFTVENMDLIPREYLLVDEKKVKAVVKVMKGNTNIPGIKVFEDPTVAIKKTRQ